MVFSDVRSHVACMMQQIRKQQRFGFLLEEDLNSLRAFEKSRFSKKINEFGHGKIVFEINSG